MRRSKLFRIAGAVFGLTLAACGAELEGQAPDSADTADTQQDTGEVLVPDTDTTEVEDDTEVTPDTDTTPDTEVEDDTEVTPDTDTNEVEDDTEVTPDTDTVEPPTGESCDDPHVIVVPSPFTAAHSVTGDTTGKQNDHAVDEFACLGMNFDEGQDAPDEAWSFTAPSAGVYRISVLSGSGDVGFYVLGSCGDEAECLGGTDFPGVGEENLDTRLFRMAQGQTVFIVVDGYEATNFGTYTLTIDPPAAFVPGDICDDAIALTLDGTTGAWTGSGDTSTTTLLTDNYEVGTCGPDFLFTGNGSQDQVFRFTAPTAGTWTATLTPDTDVDLMLYGYLGETCGQTCAGAVDDGFGGDEEELVLADLTAGQTVFFVVDSWVPQSGGAFTLSVATVCTPSCDLETCGNDDGCGGTCGCGVGEGCLSGTCAPAGETCADPIPLTAGPDNSWTGQGNLTGRVNDVTAYTTTLGCPVVGSSSLGTRPDETFSFTPATTGPYDFTVTSVGAATDVLFAVFMGPGCEAGSCLGFVDNNDEGEADDTHTLNLTAGTTYTIVVDSYTSGAVGPYTVEVAAQCVPFCAEGTCNVGDGCGGTCFCGTGEQCNTSNTCEPIPVPPGETCANPIAMDFATVAEVPTWTAAGTLVGRTADVPLLASCSNLGEGTPTANTVDQTFSFTTTTAGRYTFTLTSASGRDIWMHLFTGPGCDEGQCIGYFDTEVGAPEILTATLPAATPITIIVEPWSTFTTLDAFTVKVEKACDPDCTAGCGVADGCGNTCGCAVGQSCNQPSAPAAGTCENTPGETCAAATPMTAGDPGTWTASGDLTNSVDAHGRGSCPQLGSGTPTGTGTPDQFWSFTPTATGLHKIDLTRGTAGDVWFTIYEGTGCTNSGEEANCRGYYQRETGTAVETLTLGLTADTPYTIVVDTAFSFTTRGTYTLAVTKVCDPVCTVGECGGDDSCGGTCGCPSGQTCETGTCVAVPGDSCAAPFTSNAQTFTTTIDTCTMSNDFTVSGEAGGCQSSGSTTSNTRDFVVAYTPPITGQYRVNSTQSPDLVVNVVTGACPTTPFGTCLAGADDPAQLTFDGTAGETVYVIVDQYGTPCTTPGAQNTTLTIEYVCNRTPGICDGQLCNALDNCGQPCGCTAGQNCNEDGTCGERLGNSCNAPLVVNTETYSADFNTCVFDNNFTVTSETAGCQSNTSTAGTVHRDFVVAFTPPTTGRYTAASTQGPDLIVNVVDGACPAATFDTCLAGGDTPASATFDAVGGQTYHIVVDQWSNACSSSTTQNTTFSITKQCLPDCTGRTCDQDDGCGQLCGCPTGGVCNGSTCEAAAADSCDNPGSFTAADGVWTATGDIRGVGVVDNFRATGCTSFVEDGYVPGATVASRDQVFAFTAPSTGEFEITLDPGTSTDIYFQVISGSTCAAATCVGVMDEGGSGANEVATVDFVEGTIYWIVVDSWSASSTAPHPFTLSISGNCTPGPDECTGQACNFVTSCGTPCGCEGGLVCNAGVCEAQAYDVCSTAGALTENTTVTLDTCTLNSDFDFSAATCVSNSDGAPDAVFGFTAPTAGDYAFIVSGDGLMDININTVSDPVCPTDITTCTEAADENFDGAPETITMTLTEGQQVWLYVSGYEFFGTTDCGEVDVLVQKVQNEICDDEVDNDLDGDFDCDDDACATDPACFVEPGASCASPFQLTANGTNDVWTGTGSLVGATDDHGRGTCTQLGTFSPTGTGSADEVWSFTSTVAGAYKFDLLRGAAGDIFFYLYSAGSCADDVCLGYVERVTSGTETQTFTLAAATTYYIVVESYSSTATLGDYTLTVTKLCDPVCDGESCGGTDGCGGTCGCPAGETCQAGQCSVLEGDSCAAPFVATGITDATPYTLTVDTCTFGNDFGATSSAGGCATNSGTSHRDFVVAFTPPEAGTYVVTSTQPADLIMNIVEGTCPGSPYGTCRAGTDNGTSALMTLTLTDVTPDQTFYIVVDHWSTVTCTTARNATLTITKQCVSTGCGDACNTVDNCGNACDCDSGEECSTSGAEGPGVCEFVGFPLGENCSNPYVVGDVPIGTPYTHTVDTCTFVDDIRQSSSNGGCGFASTGGKDFFVAFTPTVSGRYNVTSTQTNVDLVVNVVSGACPTASAASCVGGNDASNVNFDATAGTTYHIYVDGYDSGDCGSTVFTISQLPPPLEVITGCPAGICAMTAGAGPNGGDLYTYTIPANQHPTANDFAAPTGCTGWGTGADILVVLPSAGYTQVASSTCTATAADSSLAVFSSDPRVAGPTLLGCSSDSPGGTSFCSRVGEVPSDSTPTTPPIPVNLNGAANVYVQVDAYGSTYFNGTSVRTFTVELIGSAPAPEANCTNDIDDDTDGSTDCDDSDCAADAACQAPVAGDSCANPVMLMPDAGGWTALGNLTGTADDFSDYDTCTLLGDTIDPGTDLDGQPDQVFEFTVPADGRYTIEVLPDAGDDLVWALYSGANCVDATCVGYLDLGLSGDEEAFNVALTANTNYYLVVDTFSDAPFGDFGVFVETCVPTVACDGTTCGTDSCGTPCTCAAGTTCNETTDVCEAASCVATDLFFSEYIEGASNDKALEVYNGTSGMIDLAGYQIWRGTNGAPATWQEITAANRYSFPAGTTLAPGEVFVLCNSAAQTDLKVQCDVQINNAIPMNYNGDDFIGLVKLGAENVLIDAIGVPSPDPGSGWTVGTGSTAEYVLIRKPDVTSGTAEWAVGATQWDAFAANASTVLTANRLGAHSMTCQP